MRKIILAISICLALAVIPGLGYSQPSQVFSQTDTFDVQDRIFQQRRYSAEIAQSQKLYLDQMETYRASERQFTISRGQFTGLDNLSSLEELVKSTHSFYVIRSKVLITYLELMHSVLLETDGVELTLKEEALSESLGTIQKLQAHLVVVEAANDRNSLNLAATEFEKIYLETESNAHFMMALVMVGNVQQIFDKSVLIQKEVKTKAETANVSALNKAEFDRSYAEIDKAVFEVRAELQAIVQIMTETKDEYNKNTYRTNLNEINKVYSKVIRVISFVEEANNKLPR